jgi:fatty-acyl-CoA synthase
MSEQTVPWVEGLTIGQTLRKAAEKWPDHDAMIFCQTGQRWTFSELDAEVDRVAAALMAIGLKPGDHVAVWATNWPQWPVMQMATARVGVVMVTVNPAYRSHELAYVLQQSDSAALFLIDKFKSSDYFALLSEAVPGWRTIAGGETDPAAPRLKHVVSFTPTAPEGMLSWTDFLAAGKTVSNAAVRECEAGLSPGDAINIQYTSGTTGFPKGATLTHRNILLNGYYVADCQALTPNDRLCVPVPFYHCFGCVLGVLGCLTQGTCLVVPGEYFVAESVLKAIETEKCTGVYGVPTMFIAMLDHPGRTPEQTATLRTGIMAGSPCPLEIMQRVVNELGAREVTIAYGLTEAAPVITQTRTDDPLELRVSTVGRPLPGVDVRIVNPANGKPLGDNEQGELCCRGHGVMLGYYNMPKQTAECIRADGWLHTGDIAVRQPNGYYRITGRIKDMVCRGGENIYPREIEEFLYTHPAVQDVAVVGVPDLKYVEEVAAWVRLRPGVTCSEEELREFCKSHLARYKIPRYIRFVETFPQTVTGKIQKYKIRETMINDLGLGSAANRETA